MIFSRIRWRIAIPYVVLLIASLVGLFLCAASLMRTMYLDRLETQLQAESRVLSEVFQEPVSRGEPGGDVQEMAERYSQLLQARVTVIRADGKVLADSEYPWSTMDNHLIRPEVRQAIHVGVGSRTRLSDTLTYEMLYVAVPITLDGTMQGVMRVAMPLSQIEAELSSLRQALIVVAVITGMAALLLSVLIAERTAAPIRRLTRVAQRLTKGDLDARLLPSTRDEVGVLTRAFNEMADTLRDTIERLDDERSHLSAVLKHMADGVLITDGRGAVQLMNPGAEQILGVKMADTLGKSLAQVARHHDIIDLWNRCYQGGEEQASLIEVDRREAFLQVIVTPLHSAEPHACLVILQDLTRVRRLETIRRDFISNISHELRTPLASLRALADTLRDGALEDPPAARRFLDRMDTEVDALAQMVCELLELSRIESGQVPVRLVSTPLKDAIVPAVERLRPQAERAGLALHLTLPEDAPNVLADAERVQQVVTNLVHNAIKFTPTGGQISVGMRVEGEEVIVVVRDTGVGIPDEVLPRIFERFYKADRARSRGGTGLGLAIAKHIVQSHGGRIWAESKEGRGSALYFSLAVAGSPADHS